MSLPWITTLCAAFSLVSLSSHAKEGIKKTEKIAIKNQVASTDSNSCSGGPDLFPRTFTTVAKKCTPAVVFIKAEGVDDAEERGSAPNDPYSDEFFQRFFGMQPRQQKKSPASQGSGFFVSPDGYILTNAHVVKGASKITVFFDGGKELDATLIGSDPHTDVAVIKAEGTDFRYLDLADSDKIEVGEWVAAIGSPFQLEATLTVGVISAKGRQDLQITDLEDFIQTDAAINPGNSGGPLLNLDGDVIGINTAIVSKSGGYMGIGFAIPSNMAKNIMNQLIDKGSVSRGFLGVSLQPVDKDIADAFHLDKAEGALVSEVFKGSPADKAGIKQGDIIVEYNNHQVKALGSFRNEISLTPPGSIVKLKINRKGKILNIDVPLGTASEALTSTSVTMQKAGLEIEDLTQEIRKQLGYKGEEGVIISKVKPGSPAALAGLRPGFLILAVNHKKISSVAEFDEAACTPDNKNRILLLVKQGSATRFYSIKMS